MAITATEVKELRERTGAGMMECKKALEASNGNIDDAIDVLRKAGQAKIVKQAGRIAAEGTVIIKQSDDRKRAFMLELNCETDFVARSDDFLRFANQVATQAFAAKIKDVNDLANVMYEGNETIEHARAQLVAKLGEKIHLRRVAYLESDSGVVGAYLHSGRIGVMVNLKKGNEDIAKNIAMHIAASAPIVVSAKDVPQDLIKKEREIFSEQAAQSGKPADIIEKMVDGRIKKYLEEVSLLGQPYVKDPSMSVEQYLKTANAEVQNFIRFVVGEGIEKKEENFAEEVMAAQTRG